MIIPTIGHASSPHNNLNNTSLTYSKKLLLPQKSTQSSKVDTTEDQYDYNHDANSIRTTFGSNSDNRIELAEKLNTIKQLMQESKHDQLQRRRRTIQPIMFASSNPCHHNVTNSSILVAPSFSNNQRNSFTSAASSTKITNYRHLIGLINDGSPNDSSFNTHDTISKQQCPSNQLISTTLTSRKGDDNSSLATHHCDPNTMNDLLNVRRRTRVTRRLSSTTYHDSSQLYSNYDYNTCSPIATNHHQQQQQQQQQQQEQEWDYFNTNTLIKNKPMHSPTLRNLTTTNNIHDGCNMNANINEKATCANYSRRRSITRGNIQHHSISSSIFKLGKITPSSYYNNIPTIYKYQHLAGNKGNTNVNSTIHKLSHSELIETDEQKVISSINMENQFMNESSLSLSKDYIQLAKTYKQMEKYRYYNPSSNKSPCILCDYCRNEEECDTINTTTTTNDNNDNCGESGKSYSLSQRNLKRSKSFNSNNDDTSKNDKFDNTLRRNGLYQVFFPCDHRCICDDCFHDYQQNTNSSKGSTSHLANSSSNKLTLDYYATHSNPNPLSSNHQEAEWTECPLCHCDIKLILDSYGRSATEIDREYRRWTMEIVPPLPSHFRISFPGLSSRRIANILSSNHTDKGKRDDYYYSYSDDDIEANIHSWTHASVKRNINTSKACVIS